MTMGFRSDLIYSLVLITALLVYAACAGNSLNLGYWYLLAVPVVMLIPGLVLRARALFLTGTAAVVVVTLLVYMAIVSSAGRDGGLVGIGHFFSALGMFVGASASAWLLRFRINATLPWLVAGFAFMGAGIGFVIAQLTVCNTLVYCGALSFPFAIWL